MLTKALGKSQTGERKNLKYNAGSTKSQLTRQGALDYLSELPSSRHYALVPSVPIVGSVTSGDSSLQLSLSADCTPHNWATSPSLERDLD